MHFVKKVLFKKGSIIDDINALVLFIVFVLMDITYRTIIAEGFDYMGFEAVPAGPLLHIFTYFIAIIVILFTRKIQDSTFSKIIIELIALLFVFPAIILFKNMNTEIQILLAHLLFFFVTYLSLLYLNIRIKGSQLKVNQRSITLFFLVVIMIIPFVITFKTDINLNNLLLRDIYDTRAAHGDLKNIYHDYTYSWLARIIIPIALIYSIREGAKFKSIILFVLLLYLFLIGAHKSVFLGTFIVLIFFFIPQKIMQLSISTAICFILITGLILHYIYADYFFAGLISRRVFFIPALLDTYYFDFFNDKPLYYSSSFLSPFLEYPYNQNPPYLIGIEYFNNNSMNANNGIISDGYSNLGWIGIIINIIIVSSILTFFNSLNINPKFIGIFVLFIISILSSALPVILLTHGGIILLIISHFMLKDSKEKPITNGLIKY